MQNVHGSTGGYLMGRRGCLEQQLGGADRRRGSGGEVIVIMKYMVTEGWKR